MTLHPLLLAELLEAEADVARQRLGGRVADVEVSGPLVYAWLTPREDGGVAIRLDGTRYDAEPFRMTVVGSDGGKLPAKQWPGELFHAIHPVLRRPFACVRGTYEYHCHPTHAADAWDAYRMRIRLADLLDHLVGKAGH
jgi:hypothetical protein